MKRAAKANPSDGDESGHTPQFRPAPEDAYYHLLRGGQVSGAIWVHEIDVEILRTKAQILVSLFSNKDRTRFERWIQVDFVYGKSPNQVEFRDDLLGGTTIEAESWFRQDGEVHVVTEGDVMSEYLIRAVPNSERDHARTWFRDLELPAT